MYNSEIQKMSMLHSSQWFLNRSKCRENPGEKDLRMLSGTGGKSIENKFKRGVARPMFITFKIKKVPSIFLQG